MEDPARIVLSLEPLDDHLIVEPVDDDVETRSGLIIPQSAEAGCASGIVTAVGADAGGIEPGTRCCSRRTSDTTSASRAPP